MRHIIEIPVPLPGSKEEQIEDSLQDDVSLAARLYFLALGSNASKPSLSSGNISKNVVELTNSYGRLALVNLSKRTVRTQ